MDWDFAVTFQFTAARRRLLGVAVVAAIAALVSIHSRPKAAASIRRRNRWHWWSFNSQPPEGGCVFCVRRWCCFRRFQFTAARRRLPRHHKFTLRGKRFQFTAARRRLLGMVLTGFWWLAFQFTAARRRLRHPLFHAAVHLAVSIHSRPKAAAAVIATSSAL